MAAARLCHGTSPATVSTPADWMSANAVKHPTATPDVT